MTDTISRRDFLNGAALTIAAGLTPLEQVLAQAAATGAAGYPPALSGLRGSTDSAYKVAHSLALEGTKFDIDTLEPEDAFDLVVVGAGISGLTAAWSFRERNPGAKILILDAHDDFGGHATRNEFTVGGRLILGYGGSETIVAPAIKFKAELGRILRRLGIATERFEKETVFHRRLYPSLGLTRGVFFDRETFGRDVLVKGDPIVQSYSEFAPRNPGGRSFADFIRDCPLSEVAKTGLIELAAGTRDYMAGMTSEQKMAKLEKLSYRQFMLDVCKLPKDAADAFQNRSADNWGFGIDALGAVECMSDGLPGAKALGLEAKIEMGDAEKAPYVVHFPDGNASLARALVRSLIPAVAPGTTMDDLVTARFDYGRLDRSGDAVRIRLSSTAIRVRNAADGQSVDVGYVTDGKVRRVRAKKAIVATYMQAIPHICPEVAKDVASAMKDNVKSPLVYNKVVIANWESFVRLGVHKITAPNSFHNTVKLDFPVSLGSYKFPRDPKQPMCVHMVHIPLAPNTGLDMRAQAKAGRARLLSTSFADFETAIRRDLTAMLGPGGFDSGRDIKAITVNRWSHGYAYTPITLWDDVEAMKPRQEAAKAKFGNIAIANSDAGWDAYAHTAMAEAVRAVDDVTGTKPPPDTPTLKERLIGRLKRG